MEKVVISLGGSIIIPGKRDGEFLRHFAAMIGPLTDDLEIFVVCGGGRIARYYIDTGRDLGAGEDKLDDMGIEVTRLNARLLQLALGGKAHDTVPCTVEETAAQGGRGRVAIMGGTTPGHTTDGVSAALAEKVGASRIVNATSVDGVYTSDPRKHSDSMKYERLTFDQLEGMMNKGKHGAGNSHVFDPMGAEIVRRCRIPLLVVDGRDIEEMRNAILGHRIKGTVIDG